jgi:hypothetical protein
MFLQGETNPVDTLLRRIDGFYGGLRWSDVNMPCVATSSSSLQCVQHHLEA